MPPSDPALWQRIRDWPLPHRDEWDEGASPRRQCGRFEDNLAKAGDWTDESAEHITGAYRRFLYLKALTGETLTPSGCIDKAWHLHLDFAQDYKALEAAVGREIAHRQGLPRQERDAAYVRGRALWRQEFDRDPDPDLWPVPLPAWRDRVGQALVLTSLAGFVLLFISIALSGGAADWQIRSAIALLGPTLLGVALCHQSSPETRSNCG